MTKDQVKKKFIFAILHSMWDLNPQPRLKPVCPILEGGILTTGLQGKSQEQVSFNAVIP